MSRKFYPEVGMKFGDLIGETITSIERMRPEWGRTYEDYLLIKCESGKRVMLHGGEVYAGEPNVEEMKRTDFFTSEEIKALSDYKEEVHQKRVAESNESKRREIERLRKELGE